MGTRSSPSIRRCVVLGAIIATGFASFFATARAQTDVASQSLPNAPGMMDHASGSELSASRAVDLSGSSAVRVQGSASSSSWVYRTRKTVEPSEPAPSLSSGDKVVLGARNAFSPFSALGWLASAGYEQLINSSPNYGTDRGAFGQRLESAAIRGSSEDVLSDSDLSNVFREDPRYYRMGPGHNLFRRAIYAGTRPILTRSDTGGTTANLSLMTGNLAGSALTNLYYPQANRGAMQTFESFGGSVGGSALGDLAREFYGDFKHVVFHSPQL